MQCEMNDFLNFTVLIVSGCTNHVAMIVHTSGSDLPICACVHSLLMVETGFHPLDACAFTYLIALC